MADRDERAGRRAFAGDGMAINSGNIQRPVDGRIQSEITADLRCRAGSRSGELQAARLALQPTAFLGRAVSDSARTRRRRKTDRAACARCRSNNLPVDLPDLDDFKPHGRPEPPLEKAPSEWLYPVIDGKRYKRETNTMPQWAGSCWYYLRFLDPQERSSA